MQKLRKIINLKNKSVIKLYLHTIAINHLIKTFYIVECVNIKPIKASVQYHYFEDISEAKKVINNIINKNKKTSIDKALDKLSNPIDAIGWIFSIITIFLAIIKVL